MLAILVLVLAALSRLLPHLFHNMAFNFTAVGAGLLFFGSRRPRWQTVLAVAVMALMDVVLTTKVYGYAFHLSGYLVTWAWYAAVCLVGSALLRKVTVLRVAGGVLASATSFFLAEQLRGVGEQRIVWSCGDVSAYPERAGCLLRCGAAVLWQRPAVDGIVCSGVLRPAGTGEADGGEHAVHARDDLALGSKQQDEGRARCAAFVVALSVR